MSTPLRMTRAAFSDLPSVDEIRGLVTRDRHLVMRFPESSSASKSGAVESLARLLPEFSVFDSGGDDKCTWITVMRVVDRETVLANADVIVSAAQQFREIATDLMHRLAAKLGWPIDAFEDAYIGSDRAGDDGNLDGAWQYSFHGLECRFENRNTGQILEVRLGFGSEFGVLDPYFFHIFLKSTPPLDAVANALPHAFHDTLRALDILEKQGLLRPISSKWGYGVVAAAS